MAFQFPSLSVKKSQSLLGVDISATTVRVMQLLATGGGHQVSAYASAPLAKGDVVKGVVEKMPNVVQALERCLSRSGVSTKQVALAMPAPAVTSRTLTFPADYSAGTMFEQIEADAHLHIPFPLDEVRFDFGKIGPSKNPDDVDVLLVAARRDQVDGRVNVAEAAGLKPIVVDIEPFCLQRAIAQSARRMPKRGKGLILAHLDIGASSSVLTVVKDHLILFQREQTFGGQQLTLDIAKRYSLSSEEAEIKKRTADLPEDYRQKLLMPFLQEAAQLAMRSLQFFYTSTPYSRVDQLMLAGGCAVMPGLLDTVIQTTQVPVVAFSPLQGYDIHKRVNRTQIKQDAPNLAVLTGLAMRSFDE
jgi:type IV pilus assembly protein PilM